MDVLSNALGIHEKALRVRNQRMELLARNIANDDTPHFKARELDFHIPGGIINYMRMTPNPRFREMKDLKTEKLPAWIDLARKA